MKAVSAILTAIAMLAVISAGAHASQPITGDAAWSGVVVVDGLVEVAEGATLTIAPGTRVLFRKGSKDAEGLAGTGIIVKGNMVAEGGPGCRIMFTSAEDGPAPGDWGEIKIFNSAGSRFTGCDFSCGGWGLHVHDSVVTVKDCTFAGNEFGGLRGKGGTVEVTGSSFTGLDIGIRYWQGAPYIHHNVITGNETGIFCRQECEGARIVYNNIYANREYDLKMGDGHASDLDAANNWWGTTDVSAIRDRIFDHSREEYIGNAQIEPVLEREVELGPGLR